MPHHPARAVVGFAVALTLVAALPARPTLGPVASVQLARGDQAVRGVEAATPLVLTDGAGRTRLVGAAPGRRLSAAPAGVREPEAAARAQLGAYARTFGLTDLAALRVLRVLAASSGQSVVRFQQMVGGVPVLGAHLVAVLDGSASLVSVAGEVSRAGSPSTYAVKASAAARTARRATAAVRHLPGSTLHASRPARARYDASLIDPGGPAGSRPVWQVEVSAPGRMDVRELVLIDASTGSVALQVNQIARVLDRVVCDNAGLAKADEVCRPGNYDRVEGQPATGIPDVDQVYDLTGATADWFAGRLGVDLTALIGSDRGDGRRLRSTTRYCGPEGCPLDNAFWSGDQMVYGAGFTSADDVVAHELTHGVTQETAGLIYWFQAGAISESMSDVFGELVDLADGVGTDGDDVRWLLGEDLSAVAGGVTRDMADPPVYGQPDHTGSDLYDFAPDYDDSGGVHTNSGVPNKTAYLLTDGTAGEPGGAFNGAAFPGIGPEKAALLYWSALQMLTPGADFTDLAGALQQGCANLAATGTGGTTSADCASVTSAVGATGLARWTGPSEPRDVHMSAGHRSVRVRWDRPASSGSSPLSSYAIWIRPPVEVEDFVAVEPTAREYVLTGLRPAVDYTVGLVAVSADGVSTPVTRRFTGSAVRAAWPAWVVYGDTVTVRGVLSGAGSVPFAGRPVRLLRRYPGESTYEPVARATTRDDGSFLLRSRPRRLGSYLVTYAGTGAVLAARSAVRTVPVRQRVTISTDPTLRQAEAPRFRGQVTPPRPGAVARLQRRDLAGSWRTVATDRLDADGRYDVTATGAARRGGVWRVTVAAPEKGGLAAGRSREVAVSIG